MQIKAATRQGIKPLIGLYAESGCGKTFSALLMARGMAGPRGKIVMVDSESGRGSLYADQIPGGYSTLELTEFSPAKYIEAITTVEEFGADVCVIDSGSHEWEGIGGVLDLAAESEQRSGRPGLHNWKQPKMEHAKFMLKLLQSRMPLIVCLRAKYKTRQVKENGKTVIVKDNQTTPIQADDFIFEMTAHAEILHDHSINLTKCSHPTLRDCFPKEGPITIQTGELLARWCAGGGTVETSAPNSKPSVSPEEKLRLAALKKRLFRITESKHGGDVAALEQYLWDEAFLDLDKQLSALTADELETMLPKVEAKLNPPK